MSASTVVVRAVQNPREMKQFLDFPYRLHRRDPNWVPQLRMDRKDTFDPIKFPFFEHGEVQPFVAWRDGKAVGTVVGITNRLHNEVHEDKTGFFGFFEAIQDNDVARALLDAASGWVKSRGMTAIRGPMNFSQNEECGLLVDGFDSPPVVMMMYNPRYYIGLIEQNGFRKAQDLYAYAVSTSIFADGTETSEKFIRIVEKVRARYGFVTRKLDMKHLDEEIERVKKVYNAAWERNWGFVPMTEHEFDHLAANLKMILDPDLAYIVEIDGEPVGFSLTLPDINQAFRGTGGHLVPALAKVLWHRWFNRFTICRVIAMGVIKEHRMRGIAGMMYLDTAKAALPKGYKMAEMSWILESNLAMRQDIEMLGGTIYKTYRVYEKAL